VRLVFGSYLLRLIESLMGLYVTEGNRSRLGEMMLQMLDSTRILHGKPKVHPTVQKRWNGIVEQVYNTLNTTSPEVYHNLERALGSRLDEVDGDGERFFYHGQLALLAFIDNRLDYENPHLLEMVKLRPQAGTFAERLFRRLESIVDLMSAQPDQRAKMAADLLKSVDQPGEIREILDFIIKVMSEDDFAHIWDENHINQIMLGFLQKRHWDNVLRDWAPVVRIYKRYGHEGDLRELAQRVQQAMGDDLREEGTTQLLLETAEMVGLHNPDFVEQFTNDTIAEDWEWVNPDNCSYEVREEGYLQMTVSPGHDLWRIGSQNAPRLLRSISGDFVIETKICDGPQGVKFGGLLAWQDECNFTRFDVSSSSVWYEGCVYHGANVDSRFIHPGIHPFQADEIWLRLERKGDRFTGYVSSDGENWYRCGWADIPMEDPIQVGIHALCPRSPATSTRFEYFRIYRPE